MRHALEPSSRAESPLEDTHREGELHPCNYAGRILGVLTPRGRTVLPSQGISGPLNGQGEELAVAAEPIVNRLPQRPINNPEENQKREEA